MDGKEITPFDFRSNSVRVVERDGEAWFVAKDVAQALGYSDASNPARLFANVPEEWKGLKPIHTLGGIQEMLCISEQGLYFFLGRSDKEAALPFQKLVAGEIMPAIRHKGYYATPQVQERLDRLENEIGTCLKTLLERSQFPMTEAEAKARHELLMEERERALRENNLMHLPWRRPVREFICPFYGRTDIVAGINDMHNIMKKIEYTTQELHRFLLKAKEIMGE